MYFFRHSFEKGQSKLQEILSMMAAMRRDTGSPESACYIGAAVSTSRTDAEDIWIGSNGSSRERASACISAPAIESIIRDEIGTGGNERHNGIGVRGMASGSGSDGGVRPTTLVGKDAGGSKSGRGGGVKTVASGGRGCGYGGVGRRPSSGKLSSGNRSYAFADINGRSSGDDVRPVAYGSGAAGCIRTDGGVGAVAVASDDSSHGHDKLTFPCTKSCGDRKSGGDIGHGEGTTASSGGFRGDARPASSSGRGTYSGRFCGLHSVDTATSNAGGRGSVKSPMHRGRGAGGSGNSGGGKAWENGKPMTVDRRGGGATPTAPELRDNNRGEGGGDVKPKATPHPSSVTGRAFSTSAPVQGGGDCIKRALDTALRSKRRRFE